jgi:hypothetical protein
MEIDMNVNETKCITTLEDTHDLTKQHEVNVTKM